MQISLTYVLAVLAGVGAIAGYFLGWIDGATAAQTLFGALSVFGIARKVDTGTMIAGGIGVKRTIW